MKTITCKKCGRKFDIESNRVITIKDQQGNTRLSIVNQAHGTVLGSEIQCACGHFA